MRGKVLDGTGKTIASGITPAYAGKSNILLDSVRVMWDHPRLCGEKSRNSAVLAINSGSPPPMRGKAVQKHAADVRSGITPAYAGKSDFLHGAGKLFWDHPRLCGEKLWRFWRRDVLQGSPPPMRGKEEFAKAEGIRIRITPAYAGKRQSFVPCFRSRQDHPRLCGEKLCKLYKKYRMQGSPPPMRGKVELCVRGFDRLGITPAYAGKSVFGLCVEESCRDHPRLCGEKTAEPL